MLLLKAERHRRMDGRLFLGEDGGVFTWSEILEGVRLFMERLLGRLGGLRGVDRGGIMGIDREIGKFRRR